MGIPVEVRCSNTLITWMCENCRALEWCNHNRRKTSWIRKVAAIVHTSPSQIRGVYEYQLNCLNDILMSERDLISEYLTIELQKVMFDVVIVGDYTAARWHGQVAPEYKVVNIDSTQLREYGKITIAYYRPS